MMNAQNITTEQDIAMLTIATWKKSNPALERWFNNAHRLYEYLQTFDSPTARTICKAHTEAGDSHKPPQAKNVGKIKTISAVALNASKVYMNVWYGRIVCKAYEFTNALTLWSICCAAALMH